jgi:GrpB-like predicted nucleotidyltransferase (UPF0157 family)
MSKQVVIVAYDPEWPKLYDEEEQLIKKTLGNRIKAIEHIGSTAVPNLRAKNIIDIMAGVNSLKEADDCLPMLDKIGYKDVLPQPGETEWYYCVGKGPHSVGYHLHLVKHHSEHWKRQITFRDFLRNNPEKAREYFNLKKQLAAKYWTDRLAYTEAKTDFVQQTLAKATH